MDYGRKPGTPGMRMDPLLAAAAPGPDSEMARMLRQYSNRLIDDFGAMTRRELRFKDIVDMRGIVDTAKIRPDAMDYLEISVDDVAYGAEEYPYCFIPCFEEGVFHMNRDRYIYWRIEEVDPGAGYLRAFLRDYSYYHEVSLWESGVHGAVEWRFVDPSEIEKENTPYLVKTAALVAAQWKVPGKVLPGGISGYDQLYKLVTPKEMGWNPRQAQLWASIIMHGYQEKQAAMRRTGMDSLQTLSMLFLRYVLRCNRILADDKAARSSRRASDADHRGYLEAKAAAKRNGTPPPKERRIRTVGAISVTSELPPRPGRRAMANYTKAAWGVRAHMRTLKSGKKVWVRKSVHKRKVLAGKTDAPGQPETTPVTLRMVDAHGKEEK